MPPMNPPAQRNGAGSAKPSTSYVSTGTGGGFDMGAFQRQLDEQKQLTANRQAEELAQAGQVKDIMGRSASLAKQQADSVGFLLKNVETSQQKATHARQLADSNNPLDRLELMGLQISDPNGYLRKQREARLQEDSQQAAILNQYFSTQQDSLKTQLVASTAGVDYMKTLEAIGQEKLTAYSTQAKMMGEALAANQTMKDVAIHGLETPELDAAIAQAKQNPQKVVNIGGIDLDVRTLEDRRSALQEREYNMQVLELNRKLKTDEVAHAGDTLAQREYERSVQKNQRDNLQTDLAIQNAERNNRAQALIQTAQQRILGTMSIKELTDLRANSYKSSTGEQYTPAAVEEAYSTRKTGEQAAIDDQLRQNMLNNFDTNTLATELQYVNQLEKKIPANSALAPSLRLYKSTLGIAAHGVGPENGDITRITAVQGYMAAKDQFDKAIEKQVVLESKGDKDLADIMRSYYRGDPVPQDSLYNAAAARLTKFKSVRDLFPAAVSPKIEAKYKELLQQGTTVGLGEPALTAEDRKIAEQNAVQGAIEYGVNESLQGKTEEVIGNQVSMPGHPLYGKSPLEFAGIASAADARAESGFMQAYGLDPTKMSQLLNGIPVEGAPAPADATAEIQFRQNQELLIGLDAKYGIDAGHAVADWWMNHGSEYIDRIQGSQSGDSLQDYNFNSASTSVVKQQFDKYAFGLNQADATYRDEIVQQAANMFTFGRSPESMQVAILSANKNLSDAEKTQIFTEVIKPLLTTAQQKGLDFDDTNRFVEQSVMNYEAQTPEMKGLLKTLRRDRAETIESMGTYSSLLKQLGAGMAYGGKVTDPKAEWYMKSQPQRKPVTQWFPKGFQLPTVEIGRPDFSLNKVFNY